MDLTSTGLQSLGFTVFANVGSTATNYFPETEFTYSDGTYTSATKYYWPSSGTLDFFAYQYSEQEYNTVSHTALTKAFTVTPSTNVDNQTDLLIAYTTGKDKATYGASGVSLNFRHAESMVTIKLKNTSTTTTITVGAVELGNVYTTGTYTFTGSTNNAEDPTLDPDTDDSNTGYYLKYTDWSSQSTLGSYSKTPYPTEYTSAVAVSEAYKMILIPQTLTHADAYASASAGAVFSGSYIKMPLKIQNTTGGAYIVGAASGEGEYVTALWPLPATQWLPGYHYTYTVDLAGGGYYPTNQNTDAGLDPILAGAEIKFVSVTVDSWPYPEIGINVPSTE